MSSKVEGQERSLEKVFSNDYAFSIPLYQRPDAWTKEQGLVLLDDVSAFLDAPTGSIDELKAYFLGCIVLIKGSDPQREVVDGQQRLTTLTLLLAALANAIEDRDFAADMEAPGLHRVGWSLSRISANVACRRASD